MQSTDVRSPADGAVSNGVFRPLVWLAPVGVVLIVSALSLLRNQVSAAEIVVFAAYWAMCLVVPGWVAHALMVGRRSNLAEDLAFGAATGLALETASWLLASRLGVEGLTRWWWVLAYIAIAVVLAVRPDARVKLAAPVRDQRSLAWNWAVAGLIVVLLVAVDVANFRTAALPPAAGSTYQDMWWHLALVQEMLRPGEVQIPQIVGEPFTYHVYSHTHVAIASATTRIDPAVVLFRLWVVPMIVLSVLSITGLARQVTGKVCAGPLAAWIAFVSLTGGYLWTARGVVSATPLTFLSPSQLLANPLILIVMAGIVTVVRNPVGPVAVTWLILVGLAAAGSKTTVLPILIGATVTAALAMIVVERRAPRRLLGIAGGLLALQAWALASAATSAGSSVTVFGTLKSVGLYRELSGDTSLRVVNDGLILDALSTANGLRAGVFTLGWFVASHLPRLLGFAALTDRKLRRDPVIWLLCGAVAAGWGATFVFDHVGASQLYFLHTVSGLGAVLTAWWIVHLVDAGDEMVGVRTFAVGMVVGSFIALIADAAVKPLLPRPEIGALEETAIPVIVVLLLGVGLVVGWRMSGRSFRRERGFPMLLSAAVLGLAVPSSLGAVVSATSEWLMPNDVVVDESDRDYVSEREQEALLWLRENSDADDVVVTNLHCRPPTNEPVYCDSRGFWVSGLSGRRTVLEGWAYTAQAQELHGLGGRTFATQLPPWPERYALSQDAFANPSAELLDDLRRNFDARWAVYIARAGQLDPALDSLATLRFDNGDVKIFEIGR